MANSAQARKRVRQTEKRRQRNMVLRSRMRTHIKKVHKAIGEGDQGTAHATFRAAQSIIDGMVRKGLIHKNKAARDKRRLAAHIKAI